MIISSFSVGRVSQSFLTRVHCSTSGIINLKRIINLERRTRLKEEIKNMSIEGKRGSWNV